MLWVDTLRQSFWIKETGVVEGMGLESEYREENRWHRDQRRGDGERSLGEGGEGGFEGEGKGPRLNVGGKRTKMW